MKKIGFALQVLGLITFMPLSVFMEMNHQNVYTPTNKNASELMQKHEKIISKETSSTLVEVKVPYIKIFLLNGI
ncbi:hypothetical protein BH11BAC3_BH11BAC3_20700 [soil metagenome]